MIKVIIQIPCFNEASTLPFVLGDLPKTINGLCCFDVASFMMESGWRCGDREESWRSECDFASGQSRVGDNICDRTSIFLVAISADGIYLSGPQM